MAAKLIVIVGPTASGKSDLAMKLAKEFNGEIVAADSRTVYRGMDIGTAKPSRQEMLQVPHHLIDIREPGQPLSAAEFKELALESIADITGRGKLPILVGGSGLYIDSVIYDYRFPATANPKLRQELEKLSSEELLDRLESVDPEAAATVDRHNRRRVIRAIETAGQPRAKSQDLRPNTLVLGLAVNKNELQSRIAQRAEFMLSKGLLVEVESLGKKYGWECEAMTGPAYRAFRGVVEGTKTQEQALADFVRGDMALAKKQMTWFKRNPHIVWLEDSHEALDLVSKFLDN